MRRSVIRSIGFVVFVCVVAGNALAQNGCLPAPTPQSPANNATGVSTQPTLTWSAVSGANAYDIYFSASSCPTQPAATVSTNSWTPPQLSASTTYYWAVRARNTSTNCFGETTACLKFSTASACTLPGAFDLKFPNNVTTGNTPQLSWNSAPGAFKYIVHLGTTNPPSPSANDPSTTSTTYQITTPLTPGTTYYWYVDAYASCNTSTPTRSTSTYTFSVRPCPTGAATLTSPAANATLPSTSAVVFDWTDVTSALSYDVMVSNDNGATFTSAGNVPAGTSTLTKSIPAGSYVWYVKTNFDAGCSSTTSQPAHFSVSNASCPTTAPTLVSPANGATNVAVPVTLAWTAVTGATGYKVYVQGTSGGPTLIGSTTDATRLITSSIPQGTVQWAVVATFDNCPQVQSQPFTFSTATQNCPTAAATLLAPANGAANVANPVTFDWSDVSGAKQYRVLVSIDGGSATPVGLTSDSQLTVSVPGSSIEWWVETLFDNCPSVSSSHAKFTTQTTSGCPVNPDSPATIAPANGATGLTSPVNLQWSAVNGAKAYVVYASINGGTGVILGTTAATQLSASLPAGTVTWLVEARFGDDCPGTVSPRASFTIANGASCANNSAPSLKSPANGATVTDSPVTFTWTAVPNAIGYNLYAGLDGTTPDLIASTTETTAARAVPSGKIDWYVEALFAGCDPVRSATSQFTVPATACPLVQTLNLVAPANGANVTSPVQLQWTTAIGATAYRVWASIDGGDAVIIARSTDTKATVSLPSGHVEWYVESVGGDCPQLSPHGTFVVVKSSSCDGHAAPVPGAPSGNVTADKVTFQWAAAQGAGAYRVWLSANGGPFSDLGFTKQTSLDRSLPPGNYAWYVEAVYDNCPAVASPQVAFVLQSATPRCGNDAPSLVAPTDKAKDVASPVTFLWSSVANAVEYRLFASVNGSEAKLIATTSDTSISKAVIPGAITWYIEAVFKDCPATQSAKSTFTAAQSPSCTGAKPELVAPANNSTTTNSSVLLDWNPVSGAAAYVVMAKHGDGAATPIGETPGSVTQLQRDFPDGKIEWWVIALPAGCTPTISTHETFTVNAVSAECEHRKPVLLAPVDGAPAIVSPVTFEWSKVAGAKNYKLWIAEDGDQPSVAASTAENHAKVGVQSGINHWFVEAQFDGCPSTFSAPSAFNALKSAPACRTPEKPVARVVGQAQSDTSYTVRWTQQANVAHYELQEATTLDFAGATTQSTTAPFAAFKHSVSAPTQYLYRVRVASSCSDEFSDWSDPVGVLILPPATNKSSAEVGAQENVVQTIHLPGSQTPVTFSAHADKPWLTVTPSSGTLGADGVTLTVTAAPGTLNLGTNTATITITYGSAGKTATNGSTPPTSVPVSVSVVTPVSPTPRNTPQPDSLIIPGIAHTAGANNANFQTDVRVANVSAQTMKYLLNFTPLGANGTQSGSSTTISIDPGATTALDDILSSFFGAAGASSGTLEVRPLTTATTNSSGFASLGVNTVTVVSSRTYNVDPNGGTLGQFIPGIPFAQFIGKSTSSLTKTILSLQQVASSSAYRTNLGLVEANGEPATVLLSVFDDQNNLLAQIPVTLDAGQYVQNNYFAANGLTFDDGRVEVEVTSSTGRVTAYASTIDNRTNDPLLVSPVLKQSTAADRYVLPGIAAINTGANNWRSDVRVFNAGTSDTTATITFIPQGDNPTPSDPLTVTLKAGAVAAFDDVLLSRFNVANGGGSLLITTPDPTSLVTSARTYNLTSTGTLGQFIPGVTVNDSVGNGDRALQLLQLEQSDRYRTNIGLAETSGQPVQLELSLTLPDSKVTPVVPINLGANEFLQIPLASFNAGTVYNGRVSVKVVGGSGKVTAYGSVIDAQTGDPTYVPAQ
jgi:Viral BACON domain